MGLINADESIKKVLIICPASIKLNWKREAEKWLVRKFKIEVAISNQLYPEAEITIINYDIIKKFKDKIKSVEYDLLVLDECQKLKNGKAQRTQLVLGKKEKKDGKWGWKHKPIEAKRILALTGTPILNRPVELWTIINALNPAMFSNFFQYAKRYCSAYRSPYGWDFSGASNLDELQEKLRTSVMVRRLKKEVLTELPLKRRQVIEISPNGCASIIQKEKQAWQEHQEQLEKLRTEVELSKASENEDDYKKAVTALKDGARVAFTEMARIRHETALAKVPFVIKHIEDVIENEKVVVFAHHKDVIAKIYEAFRDIAVVLTGETKNEDRQVAVDRFQNDPNIKLFIGSTIAAGVGLTLTASSHVIFAELDWVPANVTQAEDRTHRISQKNSVLVQHLVLEGSLDATMAQTIVAKQNVIEQALDVIVRKELAIPTVPGEKAETVRISKIDTIAEKLDVSEIPEIHTKLKKLVAWCDGAHSRDGMGFNKIDANVGHDLANRGMLTKRQAALGKIIVYKYRKQLGED